jgi:hypothetical protein
MTGSQGGKVLQCIDAPRSETDKGLRTNDGRVKAASRGRKVGGTTTGRWRGKGYEERRRERREQDGQEGMTARGIAAHDGREIGSISDPSK